ncbi:hypothetical protein P691DRAFT_807686 [Macrolepiota fuliginosa MF-IS2]|uniref:F-box domain-containing protein n=1 Tax=Macrolepiota fuliginosa MF-IS2 TaxID=1400762 RepID=A0A9P6BYH5_9AGAR|nr:hypothetical protein P691DRAFT_807686 [Macrolepiota fuliginosa MF-IS2]
MAQPSSMESLFSDKLNSNYIPNDDEVATIKELLLEPDQKLHDITGEIEEIKAQLGKLLQEKEDLNEQLKAHKALLSPARRLPPDVVQKIFLHCLPMDRNPVMSCKEAPVLLGRICSQWRDIALATPRLWAAIHIAIPSDPPVPMPMGGVPPPPAPQTTNHALRIEAITAWLTRSGAFPLSISIYNSRFDSVAGNSVQLYLDAVYTFVSRWKHLHMSVPHQVWNNFLPRVRETDAPILEKIYFDSAMGYHGVPGSPGTGTRRDSGLMKAPNLRSVTLIQFEPHILHLPLRWNRLTELNLSGSIPTWQPIEGLSITESLSILSFCPNLEYFSVQLSLAGFTPLSNGDYGLPKMTATKLLGLSITETNGVDSAPFLEHITAPKLRHLKFRRTTPNSYITVPDLAHSGTLKPIHVALAMFLRRANGPIEEFELDAMYMNEGDVMKCLSLMPGLRKLSLWAYGSGAAASPYATPPIAPWEGSLFTFEDKHLRRFVPRLSTDDAEDRFAPDTDFIPPLPDDTSASEPWYSPSGPLYVPPPGWAFTSPTLTAPRTFTPIGNSNSNDGNGNGNSNDGGGSADVAVSGDGDGGASSDANAEATASNNDAAAGPSVSTTEPLPPTGPAPSSLPTDKGKGRATSLEPFDPEAFVDVLCPLLEDFQCTGALFSDTTMLAFLRARSCLASVAEINPHKNPLSIIDSLKSTSASAPASSHSSPPSSSSKSPKASAAVPGQDYGLAHLRRCRISFSNGREESDEVKAKLDEIRKEAAMTLDVHYPPMQPSAYYRRYSPYDGLPSVPVLGVAPGPNFGGTNGTVTVSANGLSGEPVFLYSAAFH